MEKHIFNFQEEEYELLQSEEQQRPDKTWFQMRKAKIESTRMAPVPLSEHFKSLNRDYNW